MLKFTKRIVPNIGIKTSLNLSLTAEERTRSRHRFTTEEGIEISLALPRGTLLQHNDILSGENQTNLLRIIAASEAVITVTSSDRLALMRTAYHLGNRHVPLEIQTNYLRLSADPVLHQMLERLGLNINSEFVPFQPESGAYGQKNHSHR